jgi:hypothetical protein
MIGFLFCRSSNTPSPTAPDAQISEEIKLELEHADDDQGKIFLLIDK